MHLPLSNLVVRHQVDVGRMFTDHAQHAHDLPAMERRVVDRMPEQLPAREMMHPLRSEPATKRLSKVGIGEILKPQANAVPYGGPLRDQFLQPRILRENLAPDFVQRWDFIPDEALAPEALGNKKYGRA